MTVRNATQFVELCENRLGYVLDPSKEIWKARAIQAGILNKAVKKDPNLLTWRNLELAVEYLARKRQPIKSPIYATYVVKDALKLAAELEDARPLADRIRHAIAVERLRDDDFSAAWIGQLTRAVGPYRQNALDEWEATRQQEVAA